MGRRSWKSNYVEGFKTTMKTWCGKLLVATSEVMNGYSYSRLSEIAVHNTFVVERCGDASLNKMSLTPVGT
jgi:hypothetical protein